MEATTAVLLLSLVSMVTPVSDNVTEAGTNYNESTTSGRSPSSRYSSYSSYYVSPTLTLVLYIATLIISVVGCLANAYVLLALLLSKNSRSSNINVFITHQTVLDLTSCFFLFLSLVIHVNYAEVNSSLALFVCWFFGCYAMTTTASNASVGGLMIITIERYVKIVHSVAYRNHYRPWMTRAGIILPWIFGVLTGFVETAATSKVVRGRCDFNRYYASDWIQQAWGIGKFLLLYVGPLFVFVLGYWKILAVIRRQRKQVGQSKSRGTSNGAATAHQKASRRTEMNIIKTVVLVSVSFALCYLCMRTYSILTRFDVAPPIASLYLLFSVFYYSNSCLNPFIYATQYEIVRRWWKVVVFRVVRRQHVEEASVTQSVAPGGIERQQQASRIHVTTKNL